jgi:hypothetical protein
MPMYGSSFAPSDIDPTALVTVPEVATALADLETAYDRWREAASRERELARIAEQAPQEDISAVMEAVATGASKLPAPTEKKAAEAHAEAARVLDACERLCLQAEDHTRAKVEDHRDALRAAANSTLEGCVDRVDAAITELAAAMQDASIAASRVVQVGLPDVEPLTTSQPMPWLLYDPRVDGTVDGRVSLDLIAKYATDLRPSTMQERELQAITEWNMTVAGENPRYAQHRAPDGTKTWVRT